MPARALRHAIAQRSHDTFTLLNPKTINARKGIKTSDAIAIVLAIEVPISKNNKCPQGH
jgi:hypothetical protein